VTYSPLPVQQRPTSGLAVAALLTGIFFWPVGIVLSPVALAKIRRTGDGGRGLAIAGLVISIIELLVSVVLAIALAFAATMVVAGVSVAVDELDELRTVDQSVGVGETGTTYGRVSFTLESLECGIDSVGTGAAVVRADGQFCEATVAVSTIANDTLFISGVYASGYIGETQIDADSTAAVYAPDNLLPRLREIGPGDEVVGTVYFDIPADAELDRLTFSEEMFNGMVEVVL
jgi:hypothetical protein